MVNKPLHKYSGAAILGGLVLAGTRPWFEALVTAANEGDELAHGFVYRLWRYGPTDSLLRELESKVSEIRFDSHPKLDPAAGRFYWHRSVSMNQEPSLEAAYALVVVLAVNDGLAAQVKRCEGRMKVAGRTETCSRLYIGADNKLYCSNTCATRARVQAKRKRDRERGI